MRHAMLYNFQGQNEQKTYNKYIYVYKYASDLACTKYPAIGLLVDGMLMVMSYSFFDVLRCFVVFVYVTATAK